MAVYGKPDRGFDYVLSERWDKHWINDFTGLLAGDILWADLDQTLDAMEGDMVLYSRDDGMVMLCAFGEQPYGAEIVGPVVWVERGFEPREI